MLTYKSVENIRFTTDLEENRVLFTSATSFTLKRRALLPSSEPAKSLSRFWSHLLVTLCVPTKLTVSLGVPWQVAGLERTRNWFLATKLRRGDAGGDIR